MDILVGVIIGVFLVLVVIRLSNKNPEENTNYSITTDNRINSRENYRDSNSDKDNNQLDRKETSNEIDYKRNDIESKKVLDNNQTLNSIKKIDYSNIEEIRTFTSEELSKAGIKFNIRPSDGNISILSGRNAIAFIDFKRECKEYGHPVARFRQKLTIKDPRIVPFNANSIYSKRNGKLSNEEDNIGLKDQSSLDLIIKCIKSIV